MEHSSGLGNNQGEAAIEKIEYERIAEENRRLNEELSILKKQFQESVDIMPNMTELYNENSELKKEINFIKNKNDDLTKRLKIAMQTNEDLKDSQEKTKTDASQAYIEEITELQSQVSSLKKENENNTVRFQNQLSESEHSYHLLQTDISTLQSQISKVLNSSGNYFQTIFKNPNELIEYLKENSLINNTQSFPTKNEPFFEDTEATHEEKIRNLKTKLHKDKQKRSQLKISLIKLQKKSEHDAMLYEEKIQQLEDQLTSQTNEIRRLELVNQQKQIPDTPKIVKPKFRNSSCQVSLHEVEDNAHLDELKRQLLNATSIINDNESDYSTLKMKYDELSKQLKEQIAINEQTSDKFKKLNEKILVYQKELSDQKKQIDNYELKNHELNGILAQKENESKLPQQQLQSKLKNLQNDYDRIQKANDTFQSMFEKQKNDIIELTANKEKLMMIIEKMNFIINTFSDHENTSYPTQKIIEKEIAVEPKFEWQIGQLPHDICDIVKEISENDALTIESRIKNIFIVINKWIKQKQDQNEKDISDLITEKEKLVESSKAFKEKIMSACKTDIQLNENSIDENNVFNFIKKTISNKIDYQKELNALKQYNQHILEMANVDDFETLIERIEKTIETSQKILEKYEQERRKRLSMKNQFKQYVSMKEKEYNDKMDLNRKSKENARKQIDSLQNNINQLQEQNRTLIEKMKEYPDLMKKKEEEDSNSDQEEQKQDDDNQQEVVNTSNFEFENEELRIQINSLNKSIQTWKETVKEAHDENALLQQKLNQMRIEFDNTVQQLTKKNDLQSIQQNETIKNLSDQMKKQSEDYQKVITELNEKLSNAQSQYDQIMHEISQIQYEKERTLHSADLKIEAIERSKKLAEAQLKAQMMSIDSKYAILVEEEKQKAEKNKREMIEYFVNAFRSFSNIDQQLNEETFHDVVRKVKNHLQRSDKTEQAIRKLIKADNNEPLEDVLTQFVIKNHPQFHVV